MSFIQKTDMKSLNCKLLFFNRKKTAIVISINNEVQKKNPYVDLKLLFPNAKEGTRNYFLSETSDKEFAPPKYSIDGHTTYAASTQWLFADLPQELQDCIIARYSLLDETEPCTTSNLVRFLSDFYKDEKHTEGIFL